MRIYFDGKRGGADDSFFIPTPKTGSDLANTAISSNLYPKLNGETLFPTVKILRTEKVGAEVAYVVEKTPKSGDPVTDYISTTTFLLLRRDTADGPTFFQDYRTVEGVKIPFTRITHILWVGKAVTTIQEAKFNQRLADALFAPAPTKRAVAEKSKRPR